MTKTEDTTANLDIREGIKYDDEPGREEKDSNIWEYCLWPQMYI